MSHEITITTIGRIGGFTVSCSCGETFLHENLATLDELNQIAHEHIESAERSDDVCPVAHPTADPLLRDLACELPAGHTGPLNTNSRKTVHRDYSGILWIETEAAERSESYGGQPCTRPGHNHPMFRSAWR